MEQPLRQTTSYKEVRIGNTVYCVTSVFNPEKDLKKTLEDITLRRVIADITANAARSRIYFPRPAASLRGMISRSIMALPEQSGGKLSAAQSMNLTGREVKK